MHFCGTQRSLLLRKFEQSIESLFKKYSDSLFVSVNTIFLTFLISKQKATCFQVRVQAIPQSKKNMKSGPYTIRMVKRFMEDEKNKKTQKNKMYVN